MNEVKRVKVGNRVINLEAISEASIDARGCVSIWFLGDNSLEEHVRLLEQEAEAFWRFYSSRLCGCLDVVSYFAPHDPQVTHSVEVSGLTEEV